MNDIQSAITRLRAADEQHPDFWQTFQDRDADPQMIRDVVAVARAYVRKEMPSHEALLAIQELADFEYTNSKYAGSALAHIANEVLLAHYHRVCEERDRLKEAHKLLTASVAHYCESEVKREPFKKR